MTKRLTALIAAISASLAALGAEARVPVSASELLGPAYAEVVSKGKAIRFSDAGALSLIPAASSAEAFRAAIAAEKPALLVEALFLLPRSLPEGAAAREAELASIYGLLGSFGSLEGTQYWSWSRNAWRTFYAESYRVDGEKSRKRLPDPPAPRPGAVPGSESVLVLQRDLSFGENLYEYRFRSYGDAISLEARNLTRMSYGPVPAIRADGLRTRVLVLQAADAIIFYAASGADAPGLFKSRLQESFGNRADALFRWFAEKSTAFRKP